MNIDITEFLRSGFDLKNHLAKYLAISVDEIDSLLLRGSNDLAALHPGSLRSSDVKAFYEEIVGDAHLLDLSSWHLSSSNYIADTLRLQKMFAQGAVLDFGGGIGTHALAAAALPETEHVYFVDLNPTNREFVKTRANWLGLSNQISFHRDLEEIEEVEFDTIVCLDVLEHISDPAEMLLRFHGKISPSGIALMNWYFFKGYKGEYPFHFDDPKLIEAFFKTLQTNFLEVFHPYLITTRAYKKSS